MRAQLANVSVADTADSMELDEPSTGRPARAAKTVALTRPDRPMKHKRVRKEPANTEEPTSTVQAPASLAKGKRKHANSVVEVRKALNASKVQPSEALHQPEVKKVKLTPKLSRTYSAPKPLRIFGNKRSNPKVKNGTAESDPGDLDEDGEDCDEQDSLDDEDEDEELADLAVENFGEEIANLESFVANQYNDLGIKISYLLSSSLSTAPDELEVVNHMIASVATAVEACILDFTIGKSSEFVGPSHDNTFKAHMLLLLTMKQKKPLEYHKLTHSIYRAVIGMRSVGSARLSKEQIIAQVDWANMGGESD
ncbi:hypothetical protein C8R48DRAFT_769711 [Suillus tomentosus]|nr:hypothetical protein C8R48DRAFT_769711 [Suillus tomentosus]